MSNSFSEQIDFNENISTTPRKIGWLPVIGAGSAGSLGVVGSCAKIVGKSSMTASKSSRLADDIPRMAEKTNILYDSMFFTPTLLGAAMLLAGAALVVLFMQKSKKFSLPWWQEWLASFLLLGMIMVCFLIGSADIISLREISGMELSEVSLPTELYGNLCIVAIISLGTTIIPRIERRAVKWAVVLPWTLVLVGVAYGVHATNHPETAYEREMRDVRDQTLTHRLLSDSGVSIPDDHRSSNAPTIKSQDDKVDQAALEGRQDDEKDVGKIRPPQKISGRNPSYTRKAKRARVSGSVVLSFVVTKKGKVKSVKILEDPGFNLGRRAKKEVRRWKFIPALLHGKPVDSEYKITFEFTPDM